MDSIIFDFDSTIISCESLEMILGETPEIQAITEKGIRGEISFEDSLRQRLEIAKPTKQQAMTFGQQAFNYITHGMQPLIRHLIHQGVEVWIFSGGVKESVMPLALELGIERKHVLTTHVQWHKDGTFRSIIPPFEKYEYAHNHKRPSIAVGDAMSDYRLYEKGIVDDFILYTEHFQCEEVLAKGVKVAENVIKLEGLLDAKR